MIIFDPTEYAPISSVPRDGTAVIVADPDAGAFAMRWNSEGTNPLVQAHNGIWEALDGSFTWSEAQGCGPSLWKPFNRESLN